MCAAKCVFSSEIWHKHNFSILGVEDQLIQNVLHRLEEPNVDTGRACSSRTFMFKLPSLYIYHVSFSIISKNEVFREISIQSETRVANKIS